MPSGRVFEMLWDCRYCGTRKLLARNQRYCPQCGATQDPETRYFPAENEKIEVTGYEYEGVDKQCKACRSPNGARAEFCGHCGASLSNATAAPRLAVQVRTTEGAFTESLSLHRQQEAARRDLTNMLQKPVRRPGRLRWATRMGLALIIVLICSLFWTRHNIVTVTGHYWRQEISIERFGPVLASMWCNQLPPGAYGVMSRSEIRSDHRVPDRQDCHIHRVDRGDGSYREKTECQSRYWSEPVYDLRCDYRIDRWRPSRTVTTEGFSTAPRWPETGLISNRACLGCEREGERSGRYELLLQASGQREFRCALPEVRWRELPEGSRWRLAVGALDDRPRCDSLAPAGPGE
jgi:hypothetical protein